MKERYKASLKVSAEEVIVKGAIIEGHERSLFCPIDIPQRYIVRRTPKGKPPKIKLTKAPFPFFGLASVYSE